MAAPRMPLFLRPASYRLRRRRDAARMLPFFGAFLFLLPILWAPAETEARDTAPDGIFLFASWAVLIVLCAVISRTLSAPSDEDDPDSALDPDDSR